VGYLRKSFILFLLQVFIGFSTTSFRVKSIPEFYVSVEKILDQKLKDSPGFGEVYFRIIMEPGYYKIPLEDDQWEIWESSPRYYQVLRSHHLKLRIFADYWEPVDDELILDGSLPFVIKEMEKKFREGLKLSQTLIYSVHSLVEFYLSLKQAVKNRQDTLIRIPRCRSLPCVQNPKWRRRLRSVKMNQPDGMRLRIQSRFQSKDMDKYEFLRAGLAPFLAP